MATPARLTVDGQMMSCQTLDAACAARPGKADGEYKSHACGNTNPFVCGTPGSSSATVHDLDEQVLLRLMGLFDKQLLIAMELPLVGAPVVQCQCVAIVALYVISVQEAVLANILRLVTFHAEATFAPVRDPALRQPEQQNIKGKRGRSKAAGVPGAGARAGVPAGGGGANEGVQAAAAA